MNRALFLDRDGTINIDYGYINDPGKIELVPGCAEGLKYLQEKYGFLLLVVSNQSGIARGYLTQAELDAVNHKVDTLLKEKGVKITHFYYCPHHPDHADKQQCGCRKPAPGMIIKGLKDYQIDPAASYVIGDKLTDAEAGYNAGITTILLSHGDFSDPEVFSGLQNPRLFPNFVAYNFSEVCDFISKDSNEKGH
ncbi:MAG: hypothetical protein AMXMBFR48_06570 [Ignavibacteriales bacterium]